MVLSFRFQVLGFRFQAMLGKFHASPLNSRILKLINRYSRFPNGFKSAGNIDYIVPSPAF